MQSLAKVRTEMAHEIASDLSKGKLYVSSVIDPTQVWAWKKMLVTAIQHHDDVWLADEIKRVGVMKKAFSASLKGEVDHTGFASQAHSILAETEFNRFYIRGVCLKALNLGEPEVEIYIGKNWETAKRESQSLHGSKIRAYELLLEIRRHVGQPAKIFPLCAHSGLTVKLREVAA